MPTPRPFLRSILLLAFALAGCAATGPAAVEDTCATPCGGGTCDAAGVCGCPEGYAYDGVGTCVLEGTPRALHGWTLEGGARVAGGPERTAVHVDADSACQGGGVSSVMSLPEVPPGRPLVLDVALVQGVCATGACGAPVRPRLHIDGRVLLDRLDVNATRVERTFCLGAAFRTDGPVTVALRNAPDDAASCAAPARWLASVERLHVREAREGECPEAVGVPALGGRDWIVVEDPTETPATVALDGGGGLVVENGPEGQGQLLSTLAEVPRPAPGAGVALAVAARAETPVTFGMRIGRWDAGHIVGHRVVDDVGHRALHCVPAWALGTVQRLTLAVSRTLDDGARPARRGRLVLEEVAYVESATCAPSRLVNGDMEGEGGWWPNLESTGADHPRLERRSEAGGDRFLRLVPDGLCADARVLQQALAPAGVALRFRYRATEGGTLVLARDGAEAWRSLPPSAEWTEETVCLPAEAAGATLEMTFGMWGGGACTERTDVSFDLDDVALVEAGGPCTALEWR